MIDLIGRAVAVLRNEGVGGLFRSTGAYLYNQLLFDLRIRTRSYLNTKRGHRGLNRPYKRISLDPERIQLRYKGHFNQKKHLGAIKGGTWDDDVYPIKESPVYVGLRERFCEGVDWKETTYYKYKINKLKSQSEVNNYYSVSQFEERLTYVDELYEDIRDRGYKSQSELDAGNWDPNRHPLVTRAHERTGEIGVNISRDGQILHNDGIHRLSIAKILGIDEIPVQVIVRHKKWQETRNSLLRKNSIPSEYDSHPDIVSFDRRMQPADI